jgi:hypothetical protein
MTSLDQGIYPVLNGTLTDYKFPIKSIGIPPSDSGYIACNFYNYGISNIL